MDKILHQPYISVVIPAHNEEKSLAKVLADLPRNRIGEIIVVDNASTDATSQIAKDHGCIAVYEPKMGYGQACLTGIAQLNPLAEIVVFIDGDYADHGEQIGQLIDPIVHDRYDFVIGSRSLGRREPGAMTPQAFWGNKFACFLMKYFWHVQYTDLGPFRAITIDALKKMEMTDRNFGWTIEMQIKAVQQSLKVKEVPVDYRKRVGVSKISGTVKGTILAGEKIIRTILKYKYLAR